MEKQECVKEGVSPHLQHQEKSGQKRTDVPVWR